MRWRRRKEEEGISRVSSRGERKGEGGNRGHKSNVRTRSSSSKHITHHIITLNLSWMRWEEREVNEEAGEDTEKKRINRINPGER